MAIKTPDRATFWRQHLKNFRASGLTRGTYCRQHGLKVHQLAYQMDRAGKMPTDKVAFARVALAAPAAIARTAAARLRFGGDVALELDAGSDPVWIAQVIAAIGGRR